VGQRLDQLQQRIRHRSFWYPTTSFSLFLIGLLALRRGIFDNPVQHVRVIVVFMAIGIASWPVFWWGLEHLPTAFAPRSVGMLLKTGLGIVNDQWLAFTYIGAVVLLLAYRPQWTNRLALFGVAGRMALTNYVTQCIVIFILSSDFALGLHLRPYYYTLGAIALFGVTVACSHLWLSRFRYGPLEWLWRCATYLRVPPLRREPARSVE
jgi:uncharacterized protein